MTTITQNRARFSALVMKTAPITEVTDQDGARLAEMLPRKGCQVHGIKRRAGLFNTTGLNTC